MRWGTLIAGVFLLVIAAIPFAIVQVYYAEENRRERAERIRSEKQLIIPGSTDWSSEPATTDSPDEPSEPTTPDAGMVPPDDAAAVAESDRGAATYVGALRLPGSKSAVSRQLTLRTAVGERPVFTDETGLFSFAVPKGHYPFELADSAGRALYADERFRGAKPEYINLELLRPTSRLEGLIRPESVCAERFADGRYRVRVFGAAELTRGQTLFSYLHSDTKVVTSGMYFLGDDGVLADMDIPARELHAGRFRFSVAWKPSSASAAEILAVRERLSFPDEKMLPGELFVRGFVYIGRPEDEARQERQIKEYAHRAMLEVQTARDLMLYVAYQVRARGADPNDVDRGSWRQELKLLESDKRKQALSQYPPFRENSDRWRTSGFHLAAWRELIDQELPARWKLFRNVENFPYPDKYPTIASQIASLFQELSRLSRFESRLIYDALGESPHRWDYVDSDFPPEDERRLTLGRINRVSREIIEALKLGSKN